MGISVSKVLLFEEPPFSGGARNMVEKVPLETASRCPLYTRLCVLTILERVFAPPEPVGSIKLKVSLKAIVLLTGTKVLFLIQKQHRTT